MKETSQRDFFSNMDRDQRTSIRKLFRKSKEYLQNSPLVIDDVMNFFATGELPEGVEYDAEKLPQFVKPQTIKFGESLFSARTIMRYDHPMISLVKEAQVTFGYLDENDEVPPLIEIQPGEEVSSGNFSFVFTSALSAKKNLEDFQQFVTEPRPANSISEGTQVVQQWLRDRQAEELR